MLLDLSILFLTQGTGVSCVTHMFLGGECWPQINLGSEIKAIARYVSA